MSTEELEPTGLESNASEPNRDSCYENSHHVNSHVDKAAIDKAAVDKAAIYKTDVDKAAKQTAGQLEREISQKMQALYKTKLGHQTGRITCQLFDAKVAIVLENSLTQPVKLLFEENRNELAQQMRNDLNDALQPLVKTLIEEIIGVTVIDLLSDTSLSTGRTAVVGILEGAPDIRNPEAISHS